jgi:hypothetical protein
MMIYLRCDETEASCGHEEHISTDDLLLASGPPTCSRCGLEVCSKEALEHARKKIRQPHRLLGVWFMLRLIRSFEHLTFWKRRTPKQGAEGYKLCVPSPHPEASAIRLRVTDDGMLVRVKE